MASTVASPISARRPDWQPGYVPRLSYRNQLAPGETLPEQEDNAEHQPAKRPAGRGLSIKEIREALPREVPSNQTVVPYAVMRPEKPKKSFLGGIFTKEPSMAALDQVAQQMLAQHGSISPKSIPHVSSQKMPGHVPKVNSRWDGVPEHVKRREKEEREATRTSRYLYNTRPTSAGSTDDQSVIRRRSSNTASVPESWDSRSSGSRPVFQDNYSIRPESIYSTSSNTSINEGSRSPVVYATTFNYTQTPDIRKWVDGTPMPPPGPQRMLSAHSISTRSTNSSVRSGIDRSSRRPVPSDDMIPEYSSSAATTPVERSPQTPAPLLEDGNSLAESISKVHTIPASAASSRSDKRNVQNLSSTLKPANSVRKNSRAGLGVRPTNEIAPWENQISPSEAAKSIPADFSTKSRVKGRLFGKEKK